MRSLNNENMIIVFERLHSPHKLLRDQLIFIMFIFSSSLQKIQMKVQGF